MKSNLNSFFFSFSFLGTLFILGCQAQNNCQLLNERENQNIIQRCKQGEITTKEEYYGADFLQSIKVLDGNALRALINRAITKDHARLGYSPCTWVALEDIDETPGDNSTITTFYSRDAIDKNKCASGSRSSLKNYWNREHLFPSSRFGKRAPAYTDLHHLVASDKEVNGARGNLDFNFVETSTGTTDDCTDCKRTGTYWEPGNNKKGQLARILFYMDLRYEPGSEFDLSLETSPGRSGSFSLGDRTALLKWHCSNKVTEEERIRNNKVQKWQGNRNPFVDYPELVKKVYGDIGECTELVDPEPEVPDVVEPEPDTTTDTTETTVQIVSALVNPSGSDSGKETVTIKNVGAAPVNLKGWTIAGNNERASPVVTDDFFLRSGEEYDIVGLGENGGAQLTNKGNSKIILYDNAGNIVNEVKYASKPSSGEKIRFSSDEL